MAARISLSLLVFLAISCGTIRAQVVDTEYGPVRGNTIEVNLDSRSVTIESFYGIPFATPPVGDLRFEPPQKHQGWTGELNAQELPDVCMQNPVGLMFMTHPFWTKYDEDCLNMNIFKPATVIAPMAVFVWFHGGGYTGGGNVQYPGHFLAARDVVVVVPNYRLGVFGFASTPDQVIRGNMGMLDQIIALEFIRDNIINFGGNPNRVTIFGQSAGASSAALLVVSPLARGLFHQAILESGSENNVWTLNYPGQSPENYIYQVADNLNCTYTTTEEMLTCLRAASARDLRIADSIECTPGHFCQGFAPIVDGPGGFMPDYPITLKEQLGTANVPQIAGICRDDGSLYTIYFIPEALDGGFNSTEYEYYLRTRLVDIFYETFANEEWYENSYKAMEWYYRPWPYIEDLDANRDAFNRIMTDMAFGFAWDRNAKLTSEFAPTYTYIQSFRSLNASSFVPERWECHTMVNWLMYGPTAI